MISWNYDIIKVKKSKGLTSCIIAVGKSVAEPKFPHAVIWKNGKVVHNPNPKSGRGILGKPKYFLALVKRI